MFNRRGNLRTTLLAKSGDDVKIYAKALGIHTNVGRIPKIKNEIIDEIIHKVETSPNLYTDWMSRVDAGNTLLYKPTTLLERKNVKELIVIAEKYGINSLKHKSKDELIRLIRGRMEDQKEEKKVEKEENHSRHFEDYHPRYTKNDRFSRSSITMDHIPPE
jgi:hypothetical protein